MGCHQKGYPQGSILGPLLFNVFVMTCFISWKKCEVYDYADDNSTYVASCHIHDILSYFSRYCKNVVKWFRDNGMQPNPSKFRFMIICHSPVDTGNARLQIHDIVLKYKSRGKVLGATLASKLNFNHHVSAMCTKAVNVLARISRFPAKHQITYGYFQQFYQQQFYLLSTSMAVLRKKDWW